MNRTQALCEAFGWQGGTIHQIAAETGCKVDDLLYSDTHDTATAYSQGYFAGATRDVRFNCEQVYPNFKGNLDFWLGVADGWRRDD